MNPEFDNSRVAEHFEDLQKIKSFDLSDEKRISVLSTILARTLFYYVYDLYNCDGIYKYNSVFNAEDKGKDIVKDVSIFCYGDNGSPGEDDIDIVVEHNERYVL